ncbi:NAD(P)H-binding protein [Allobranchiibius sp. CTAmp26]|uniref:NAD(P)H-binding protein n=1 Tax=Allobranchiibius sp. CTAmp26 TaxID=2815214 RepID=UPI001AA1D170|nr:NAD(P)H-binding protein [Allobranchiibius sp. CTAmp26]MBO1754956.1 NAD(P)H-binding protein [Allobranchiibius sp. CTAmp26]
MIVITTPTGDIGSQVLELLAADSEDLRVVVRDPGRLADSVRDRVDIVQGSHGDAEVVDRAFAGADAVFWLAPPNPGAPSLDAMYSDFARPAARAITTHGVGHVVGVSALGRGTPVAGRAGLVTGTLAMDDLLGATGAAYRALANPGFMDNVLRQVDSIRDEGVFTEAAILDRPAPRVATRDIAAAAARLLSDRSWSGTSTLPLLGPQDLSPQDMAGIMSEVLGRPIRCERQSYDDLSGTLSGYGAGAAFTQGMADMMRAKDDGLDAGVPRTPRQRAPRRSGSGAKKC